MATQKVEIVSSSHKSYAQFIRAQLSAADAARREGHLYEMDYAVEQLKWAVQKWEYALRG